MPRSTNDLPELVLVVLISFVILFLGIAVANPLAEQTGTTDTEDTVLLDGTGEWVTISDTIGVEETVYDSRGYAVQLTGANDSYVQSDASVDVSGSGEWTVSQYASVNASAASSTQTALSVDGRLLITYNGSQSEWRAWYYDDGSRDSYEVSVPAPNQPGSLANLQVVSNGTHLTLYRDNAASNTTNITTDSIVGAPVESGNWHGRLDETRTFSKPLNDSERQRLVDVPVGPHRTGNRTARVMYDEPERSKQRIFFSSAELATSNASYTTGLSGSVMDGAGTWNNITGQTDYVWDTQGPQIYPVDGGELDAAPVAYVDWESQGATGTFARDFAEAIQFAGLALVVAILSTIVFVLQVTRRRR